MPTTCTFAFDRTPPVYCGGETINGHITLRTTEEKTVNGVYILFEGIAKVLWRENSTGNDFKEYEEFTADETYLNAQTRVFGDAVLPIGTHEYIFKIPLPLECPSSCTEKNLLVHGKIKYKISLRLDRPLGSDKVFTQPLIIMERLNLNHNPMYLIPLTAADIKYPCSYLFSSGAVISTITLPFCGWVPDEEINFKLEVDNRTRSRFSFSIILKLVQTYSFTAHRPSYKTRTHKKTLVRFEQPNQNVLRLSKCDFDGKLRVPEVPPTSMNDSIIKVSYHIEMNIYTGGCQKDSKHLIPITIGTIPLITTKVSAKQHIRKQLE